MFCYKCGNQLPNGSKFCSKCGANQNISDVQPQEYVQQPQQPIEQPQGFVQQPQQPIEQPQNSVHPGMQIMQDNQNFANVSEVPPAVLAPENSKSKKNIKTTIIASAVALTVAIGGFAAYKIMKKDKPEPKPEPTPAPIEETGSYIYWSPLDSRVAATINSYNDMLMYQELEKRTGVEVDFVHPAMGSTANEAFQILLSSDDKPDMIEFNWSAYPGGADSAIKDQVIINIGKYMKDCAPNYYELMEGGNHKYHDPSIKAESISPEGNYYGFKQINIGSYRGFAGLYIRKDMLDSWGLEVPVTIDDWTNVLKTAKENGVENPLTGTYSLFSLSGPSAFNGAWHVGKTYHVENGEVKLSIEDPAYKDYIATMAQWYSAGYIDPDLLVNDSEMILANMTSGASIATFGYVGSGMGKLLTAMSEKDPNYSLVACPYPVLTEGDESWFQELYNKASEPSIAITYDCGKDNEERYKEAINWCDYLYSEDGEILKCFGVEGETFEEVEDGTYKYTGTVTEPNEYRELNAQSVEAALYHFFRPAGAPGFNQHDDYLREFYSYPEQFEALGVWNTYLDAAEKHQLPALQYTADEISANNELLSLGASDSIDMVISDIIMGKKDISEFDSAVATAKAEAYDELLAIRQSAYDRYLDNLR